MRGDSGADRFEPSNCRQPAAALTRFVSSKHPKNRHRNAVISGRRTRWRYLSAAAGAVKWKFPLALARRLRRRNGNAGRGRRDCTTARKLHI